MPVRSGAIRMDSAWFQTFPEAPAYCGGAKSKLSQGFPVQASIWACPKTHFQPVSAWVTALSDGSKPKYRTGFNLVSTSVAQQWRIKLKEIIMAQDSNNPNDINWDALRLPQNFNEITQVKLQILKVAIRKPNKHEFIRVRPGDEWKCKVLTYKTGDVDELFVVAPAMLSALQQLTTPTQLHTAITQDGIVFLLPVTLPSSDGKPNSWNDTKAAAVQNAELNWVRIVANQARKAYDINLPVNPKPDPEWPDYSFDELLKLAFKGNVIDSIDHPVVKKILGA